MPNNRENGLAIKRPYLYNRQVTPYSEVAQLSRSRALVKLVDLDTSRPGGTIYETQVSDGLLGLQKVRILNTTKPYNPDFIDSAQVLTFILPEDPAKAIITPLDGTWETWQTFLKTHRIATEAMIDFYKRLGKKDFKVFSGIGFGPYSDQDYLKTQSIKAAHLHSFLITPELERNSTTFRTKEDLRRIHRQAGTSNEEAGKDLRRFFPNKLFEIYTKAIIPIVMNQIQSRSFEKLHDFSSIFTQHDGRFPVSGISFSVDNWEAMDSREFFDIMRIAYGTLDAFYRTTLMPIFTANYEEVISEDYPDPKKLIYNQEETALRIFDEKINLPLFSNISQQERNEWRSVVGDLSRRLSVKKPDMFSLGPGCSITIDYSSEREGLKVYIASSPFGGGAVEAMGIDKIPVTEEEQEILLNKFYSPESVAIETGLQEEIKKRFLDPNDRLN